MRKYSSILLAAILAMGCLSGCGQKDIADSSDVTMESTETSSETSTENDTDKLKSSYNHFPGVRLGKADCRRPGRQYGSDAAA